MRFGIHLGASITHMSINLSSKPGIFCKDSATQKIGVGSASFTNKPLHHRVLLLRKNPIVWDNLSPAIIVLAYTLAVYSVHSLLGIRDKLILLFFSTSFALMAVIFTGLFFLFHIWNNSYRCLSSRRYVIGFLTIFILMPLFKSTFASYKQSIPLIHSFSWDISLMRLDYIFHFGHHPWRLLEPMLSSPMLIRAIDILYSSWFYLLFLSCLWMAWTPRRSLRLCYLVSTLLVWILIGSFLASIFSSAGPCFYSHVVSTNNDPYAPLMRRLSEISELTIRNNGRHLHATFNQAGLWEGMITGTWGPFGGISAMPSIHLAMATLYAWLAFEIRKWLGWISIAYVVLILIGSIILGWHYAIDGYAGIILASLIWLGIKRLVYRTVPQTALS